MKPYTNEEAMRPDGTIARTARFDLRCTPSMYARVWKTLEEFKVAYGMEKESCAEVFEKVCIFVLEHHLRDLRLGDSAMRRYLRAKAAPMPVEDHVRNMRVRFGA